MMSKSCLISSIRKVSSLPVLILLAVLLLMPREAVAAVAANEFEQANKLYEQGKFKDAAAVYERLIKQGIESPAIFFNLGNAWYKAGQNGLAVAAYLRAERLAPRDPAIRFNLDFIRRKVTGQGLIKLPALRRK